MGVDLEPEIDGFVLHLATERGLSENYQLLVRRVLEDFAQWMSGAGSRAGGGGEEDGAIGAWSRVGTDDLAAYLMGRKEDGLAASSLRVVAIALRVFFRFLHGRGRIASDPSAALLSPRADRHLPETLNEREVARLLEGVDISRALGLRDRAILELLYASGLRVSELVSATLDALNIEEGVIRVTGKGSKTRLVPVGRAACEALAAYLAAERPRLVRRRTGSHVFLSRRGGRLTPQRVWQIVGERARAAGLEAKVYPHLLRHSFATHLLSHGADLRVIQELLGHADIATTQIYTHVDDRRLKSVHRKFHPRP